MTLILRRLDQILHVKDNAAIRPTEELLQKFSNDWAQERIGEDGPKGNDQEVVRIELYDAIMGLKTKDIISFENENMPMKILRLRVGLFSYLFL
jgi:hypothetical protein